MSKALYILRSTKNYLTQKARKAVYYSLLHCNLIYCLPIYSCTAMQNLKHLVSSQKAAVRIVFGSKYNDHTEPIFKSLSILSFHKLVHFFNLQIMQRFKQGFLPTSFSQTWTTNIYSRDPTFEITLRNQNNLNIPFSRLASSDKKPYTNLPKTWENFPNENIKIIRNCAEFNSKLKLYFLNELSSTPVCNRLLCPVCHLRSIP